MRESFGLSVYREAQEIRPAHLFVVTGISIEQARI